MWKSPKGINSIRLKLSAFVPFYHASCWRLISVCLYPIMDSAATTPFSSSPSLPTYLFICCCF